MVRPLVVGQKPALVACCSDGAGSALMSAEGALLACQATAQRAANDLKELGTLQAISREHVAGWCRSAADELAKLARRHHAEPRETACTLLTALLTEEHSLFVQIGDGGMVIEHENGNGYEVVFWPQGGEYAGTTHFLTDDNADEAFVFQWLNRPVHRLAMFTDGLQMLTLDFQEHKVFRPFFDPMFQTLEDSEDTTLIQEPFYEFLQSEQVNSRTDDDRTLILVSRRSS